MFCQMNPFKNMSFNQKKNNQWATLSSLMSVSLNKITKTLMNFRSSRNTFTISSTCIENQGFSELWGKHFTYCLENQGFSELWRKRSTYFLPGCHLLQSPVCQQWWTVGKVLIFVQKMISFKKYLTWFAIKLDILGTLTIGPGDPVRLPSHGPESRQVALVTGPLERT